jgi:hypothetical protein
MTAANHQAPVQGGAPAGAASGECGGWVRSPPNRLREPRRVGAGAAARTPRLRRLRERGRGWRATGHSAAWPLWRGPGSESALGPVDTCRRGHLLRPARGRATEERGRPRTWRLCPGRRAAGRAHCLPSYRLPPVTWITGIKVDVWRRRLASTSGVGSLASWRQLESAYRLRVGDLRFGGKGSAVAAARPWL